MAKSRLSAPIRREIDRQRIMRILCSDSEFGVHFSVLFNDPHDMEEEERKWKEDIRQMKEMLAEYQKANGGPASRF